MSAWLPPDGVEIFEAGLLIRPWRAADAEAVYRACQDPVISRWTNVAVPYLPGHAKAFVTTFTETSWKSGSAAPLGVFDEATGQMLGSTGLVMINGAKAEAEIGYWTAPWARRRGHATNAARAVARWALERLDLTRLIWRAEVGNHVSRLIAVRIGVQVEGVVRHAVMRRGGIPVDGWTGSLLPGQLREAHAPVDPFAPLRAATFSAPQPHLSATPNAPQPHLRTAETGAPVRDEPALRAPQWRDIPAIVTACQDPESIRWTVVPSPYTRADAEFFVTEHVPRRWALGEDAVFAIVDPNDEYAGSMELRLTGPRTGGVGYLVAPWARRRGYAAKALRALCAWGFDCLGLHRIEWEAYVGNDASRRTAEKAGFTVEGVVRAGGLHRGQYRDAWTGAKLSTDPR